MQADDVIKVHPGEARSIGRLETGDEMTHLRESIDEDDDDDDDDEVSFIVATGLSARRHTIDC